MTPRDMALAYRIWSYADPRGWDVTIPELADEMGVQHQKITRLLRNKGWVGRVRRVSPWGRDFGSQSRPAREAYLGTRDAITEFQKMAVAEAWE